MLIKIARPLLQKRDRDFTHGQRHKPFNELKADNIGPDDLKAGKIYIVKVKFADIGGFS